MVGGNGRNQFGQYTRKFAGNQNRYNAIQNVRNQVVQNAFLNPSIQNVGNQNGLIVVPGIANQNVNQTGNGNVVVARVRGNGNRNNGDIDEIEEVNANCILIANLLQASTSGTQTDKALVYDSYGSAEVHHYENCYDNEIFNMFTQEEQDTELLTITECRYQFQPEFGQINPFKTFREENFVPINKARASVRTNSITFAQPHVITKKDVNSNSNGLSSTRIDNTDKTRRPQPRSNTKNDRVSSTSKSSCIKNKEVKAE
ncbi:hypothetical protein Tco_0615920 [Tanacetum coccineum]